MKTVAITGHRPEKIDNPALIQQMIADALKLEILPSWLIQGMAAGVDLWSGAIALNLGIPYTAAKPWKGHAPRKSDEGLYEKVLKGASEIKNVTEFENYPGAWVYQKRNEWMVNHCDVLLAVYDGSPGGTANCCKYAYGKKVPIYHINPATGQKGWVDYLPDDYG